MILIMIADIFLKITVIMYPFAFEKEIYLQQQQKNLDQPSLLSALFLTILQNQRLHHQLNQYYNKNQISFSIKHFDSKEQEYHLQQQLNKVKIENLINNQKQLQIQLGQSQKQQQELRQKVNNNQKKYKEDLLEAKSQLAYYKTKCEEDSVNAKKYSKLQSQYKTVRNELESKNKELHLRIQQLQRRNTDLQAQNSILVVQNDRKTKQMRNNLQNMRNQISIKQKQCFSLKASLEDCPKLQQLNRWISKVKQYEQRQIQACGKMSQISQQLLSTRQKYRKLQHQHKQLQKTKQQLQSALTQNRGNEQSMVIYFQRLQTYEKVIKQLQQQIKRLEDESKNKQRQYRSKIESLEKDKESLGVQWKIIAEQMDKQKSILAALQKQVETYQKHLSQQSQRHTAALQDRITSEITRQNNAIINKSYNQYNLPYSYIQNSKVSEKSNRSLSVQSSKRGDMIRSNLQTQAPTITPYQAHQNSYDNLSRQTRAQSSSVMKTSSQQRLIYHSDPNSRNSTSRLHTNNSLMSLQQDHGCGDCISRTQNRQQYQNYSAQNITQYRNHYSNQLRSDLTQIKDQKKLLMQKLNILKPQDQNKTTDRNISNLYNKNYRQNIQSSQSIIKLNHAQSSKQVGGHLSSGNRLQIRHKNQQKQNLNDMIVKRYANLLGRT